MLCACANHENESSESRLAVQIQEGKMEELAVRLPVYAKRVKLQAASQKQATVKPRPRQPRSPKPGLQFRAAPIGSNCFHCETEFLSLSLCHHGLLAITQVSPLAATKRAPRDIRVPRHYQVQDARYVPDHD